MHGSNVVSAHLLEVSVSTRSRNDAPSRKGWWTINDLKTKASNKWVPPPLPSCDSPSTSRRFALGATNARLVGGKPDVLRPGIVGMRGSMLIRLRSCNVTSTLPHRHPYHRQSHLPPGPRCSRGRRSHRRRQAGQRRTNERRRIPQRRPRQGGAQHQCCRSLHRDPLKTERGLPSATLVCSSSESEGWGHVQAAGGGAEDAVLAIQIGTAGSCPSCCGVWAILGYPNGFPTDT